MSCKVNGEIRSGRPSHADRRACEFADGPSATRVASEDAFFSRRAPFPTSLRRLWNPRHGRQGFLGSRLWVVALLMCWGRALGETSVSPDQIEFFEKKIRPVLSERCYSCHSAGAEKLKGGLRLDSRDGLLKGGDTGPAFVPGSAATSLLLKAIRYEDTDLKMPPKSRLPDAVIKDVSDWVAMGAPWPREAVASSAKGEKFDLEERRLKHWAWQPVAPRRLPQGMAPGSFLSGIDAWIAVRHRELGLKAAPLADKAVLLRRLSFDLIGMPPTRQELEAFQADASPNAWEKQVDRLLASPHFGERWARHWLDLARYSETLGHEFDYPQYNAWRYRDYLVRSFNQDLPYAQLVTEHVAGDLISPPRWNAAEHFNESILGTSIYWLGQREHSPVDIRVHQAEVVDNQIDVLTKSFLGVTVACARCHDHKFDAISTRDYYALFGILGSSRYSQASIDPADLNGGAIEKAAAAKSSLRASVAQAWVEKLGSLHVSNLVALAGAGDPVHAPGSLRPSDRLFVDFGTASAPGWFPEGEALAAGLAKPGDFVPGSSNRPIASLVSKPQIHSGVRGRRLQGVLRSPTFELSHPYVHILAAGRGTRVSLPVHNFTMIRDPIYGALRRPIASESAHWITMNVGMWKGLQGYLEFCDLTTPDLADDVQRERLSPEGWFAVHRIVFSNESSPPPSTSPESSLEPEALRTRLISIARKWGSRAEVVPDELRSLAVALDRGILNFEPGALPARASADLAEWVRLENNLVEPRRSSALVEGTGLDEKVFVRGNPKTPGELVSRRFLEALGGTAKPPMREGSGRLDLARHMTDPANPLFTRVLVNRVWLQLFGRGIVPTPDDFGVLGQPPSHPELLDWLADWFRTEGGGSIKQLLRLMALSEAYRRSSATHDVATEAKDPMNLTWHRMPIKRLQGEAIRDSMLTLSRRLDRAMYGTPVPIHLTDFMEGRGRPSRSGPLDGGGRRSVYVEVRRNFVSPMMRAFDTPVPFTTVGLRTVSNVPAQSLILMNDPFVVAQARGWAAHVLSRGRIADTERIAFLYEEAFSRRPTPEERDRALRFLTEQRADSGGVVSHAGDDGAARGAKVELAAWSDLCHVLFNVKEFIFIP